MVFSGRENDDYRGEPQEPPEPEPNGPRAWLLEWTHSGEELGSRLYDDERHCLLDAEKDGGVCRALYDQTAIDAAVSGARAAIYGAEQAQIEAPLRATIERLRAALLDTAETASLRAEANKAERRAIMFGDIVNSQIVAMQTAVLEGHLKTPAHGLQWIANTLSGPGYLPDLDEARALGGAQAWWDRETAKHDEFRAAHPGPAPLGPNVEFTGCRRQSGAAQG